MRQTWSRGLGETENGEDKKKVPVSKNVCINNKTELINVVVVVKNVEVNTRLFID